MYRGRNLLLSVVLHDFRRGGGKKVKKSQKNVENTRKGPQTTENHVFCRLFGPVRIPQTLPESTVNEREKKRKQVSPPVENVRNRLIAIHGRYLHDRFVFLFIYFFLGGGVIDIRIECFAKVLNECEAHCDFPCSL